MTVSRPQANSLDREPRDYADFYRATAARTFGAARRMAGGDEHLARDAMQEAYLAMWRCWEEWTARSLRDAGRYVVKIAVRKVADAYRRKTDLAWPDDYEPTDHESGYEEVLGQPLFDAVLELIDRQPVRRRAVAVLFFLEDFTCAEIAEALDIAASTVRTHIERTRELMKPLVDRDQDTGRGERS